VETGFRYDMPHANRRISNRCDHYSVCRRHGPSGRQDSHVVLENDRRQGLKVPVEPHQKTKMHET